MIKDTDEQPDEETCKVRCVGALSAGGPVPGELRRAPPPPGCGWVHQPGSSLDRLLLGFFFN